MGKTKLSYELVVNNTWMPLKVATGQTLQVQLKRLDVNHVTVTREDGANYQAPGNYQVYVQDSEITGGWRLLEVVAPEYYSGNYCAPSYAYKAYHTFPTQTGLDVLPGVYKVVITYKTVEGEKQTEQVVDLR